LFVSKARNLPYCGAPERFLTRVSSGLEKPADLN
jgi:hypothetical protein